MSAGHKGKNTRNFGWMPVDPEKAVAAARIRLKFGDGFADVLAMGIVNHLRGNHEEQ